MYQNKGIGAYQNRPGYFMGGMIGGAILGALVNKIQGKDWKRGAIMGGIGGGLGSWAGKAFGSTLTGANAAKLPWWQKMLYADQGGVPGKNTFALKLAPWKIGAAAGAGASYLAGDPEYDREKQEEAMAFELEERKRKNKEMYPDWYKNFWPGFFNKGGIINARPGYYGGGPTGGSWSDVPMEEGGPTQDPIPLQLRM